MTLKKGEKYWIAECNSLIGQGDSPMEAVVQLMELMYEE